MSVVIQANTSEPLEGFNCLIEPFSVMDISTREQGVLEKHLVERGATVKAGQPLARLESETEQVAVELARARAGLDAVIEERSVAKAFAERQRDRILQLSKRKAVSVEEKDRAETEAKRAALQLSQARNDLKVAKLELRRAETALSKRTIRSPVDGVVTRKLLMAGESVEDRPIIQVAEIDVLNVEIIVPVERFGEINPGMMAEITPVVPGADARTATVRVVDQVVDAASGTFGVQLELPNADHKLPGGLKCEIRFVTSREDSIAKH